MAMRYAAMRAACLMGGFLAMTTYERLSIGEGLDLVVIGMLYFARIDRVALYV